MNTISALSVLSCLIGIIGFFFPIEWKNKKIFKLVFVLILLILSTYIVILNSKIERIERISKSANLLIENREKKFTDEGFILAGLSFLEQNKSDFPESYERAKRIFEEYKKKDDKDFKSITTASEIEGLIGGISILSTVGKE